MVVGGQAALAAKKATSSIPIVMATVADPVGAGLVATLGRPAGNVTGNSSLANELATKRLEILKDTIPGLSRVGVMRSSMDTVLRDLQINDLKASAEALKIKMEEIGIQTEPTGLESAFKTAN